MAWTWALNWKEKKKLKIKKSKKKQKNIDQQEYQRVPNLIYEDFDNCLSSFQKDLKTISENQNIKIVLLIYEAQVMFFLFIFLLELSILEQGSSNDKKALHLL